MESRAIVKVVQKPERANPKVQIASPIANKPVNGGWYSIKYGVPLEEPIEGRTRAHRLWNMLGRAIKIKATGTRQYLSGVRDIFADRELTVIDMTGAPGPQISTIQKGGKEAQL